MRIQTAEEADLIAEIARIHDTREIAVANLHTDDRILARITDGIYRVPSAALRELVSNAYDADATTVVIQTDAPRFDRILVRDDGSGMDRESLARLIYHIGGSTKRRKDGAELHTTSQIDASLSPLGRKLIGKIGIGLFSVAQLTRHFQIITKVNGTNYRLVADVVLRTYTEDEAPNSNPPDDAGRERVETGIVHIVSVPADDIGSHGTEITLLDLRRQARELLQSKEVWDIVAADEADDTDSSLSVVQPKYHIGQVGTDPDALLRSPKLPWLNDDPPEVRFVKLYQAVVDEVGVTGQNPRLQTTLDNYLRALWTLSLSAPVEYIGPHPFDLHATDDLSFYTLAKGDIGQAKPLEVGKDQTVRGVLSLKSPVRGATPMPFRVVVDDIELRRPIRFHDLPQTSQVLKKPMLFYGAASPDLSRIRSDERGGNLSFEAYFMWAPKIVPVENIGLLIRIGDASGTLFDDSFAKYQVAELTRLKQLTAEVFVLEGLDAALNIDRESFNTSHPHYQYIMKWTHRSLRQIMNTLKQAASSGQSAVLRMEQDARMGALEDIVRESIIHVSGDKSAVPIDIEIEDAGTHDLAQSRNEGKLSLDAQVVFRHMPTAKRSRTRVRGEEALFRSQVKAVTQVLDAYGLLDRLTYQQQEELLSAIVAIFSVGKDS